MWNSAVGSTSCLQYGTISWRVVHVECVNCVFLAARCACVKKEDDYFVGLKAYIAFNFGNPTDDHGRHKNPGVWLLADSPLHRMWWPGRIPDP